jgi:hypothetical protein
MHHKHLSVTSSTCADTYHRYGQLRCHASGKIGGYLLQHDSEASRILKQMSIFEQLRSLSLFAGTHVVCAELVDRLWGESEMPHHWDACRENPLYALDYLFATLHLHGFGVALLHDADC